MDPPSPQPQQPDPLLEQQAQAAQAANIAALTTQAQGDTASLMARYGTRLALGGAAGGTTTGTAPAGSPLSSSFSGFFGRAGLMANVITAAAAAGAR